MPIETEPKLKTQEELERMSDEELRDMIADLKDRIEKKKGEIERFGETIQEGIKDNPKLKKKLEKIKKRRDKKVGELTREEEDKKGERERAIAEIKQNIAAIRTEHFNERYIPKHLLYDPDFMRYVPGDKFMALMESRGLDDREKETITRARFKFCFDWLRDPKYLEYRKKKEAYEEAFSKWLADPQTHYPVDEQGNEIKEPAFAEHPEIREMFRNDIRNIKELVVINQFMSELFNYFDFVGHIRFGMIQDIRKHESFAGRGRDIRKVKVTDFYDITGQIENLGIRTEQSKKYFETFDRNQLAALRKRMDKAFRGKERTEISGIGSGAWKSPITLDLMDRTICQGFRSSDEGDKRIIAKHIVIGLYYGKSSSDNLDALKWLRRERTGHQFFILDEGTIRDLLEEEGLDYDKVAEVLESDDFRYDDK